MSYRIIDTCNFDSDYPNETFLPLFFYSEEHAQAVANAINAGYDENHPRFFKVVPVGYQLLKDFVI